LAFLFNSDKIFSKGIIGKVLDSRHANIKFEKGGRQNNQSFRNIIKMGSTSTILCVSIFIKLFGEIFFSIK
jgi:hypothetical protein